MGQTVEEATGKTKTPVTDSFETFSEKVKNDYQEFMKCYEDRDTYSDGDCVDVAKDMIVEMYGMIKQVEEEIAKYKANH